MTVASSPPALAANATVDKFAQCANGTGTATDCSGGWVNGTLQNSNSHYAEDHVVPQRVVLNLPADNLVHTLTFTYQDRKGTVHAYDSLATWNKTVSNADPCQGIAALCGGSPSTLQMTADPATIPPSGAGISQVVSAHDLDDADRFWTMYGGVLTGDAVVTHDSPVSGDDLVTASVSFRNPTPGTARQAVLLFGGHLAVGGPNTLPRAWGLNLGASSVSGGPYAFKLSTIDGGSSGGTANSIQAGSTDPVPAAAFTITKSASPTTAQPGQQVTYTITVKNTGGQPGTTTFRDDYANSLTPGAVTTTPSGGTCVANTVSGNKVLDCTTSSIAANGTQVFTYTATMPTSFSGSAGGGTCTSTQYPIANTATLNGGNTAVGAGPASATVCVNASSQFTITKTVASTDVDAGDSVTYTVTVKNTGAAAGSTSFVDDFDDRLSPSTAVSNPAGNNCSPTTSGNKVFSCTTGTLAAGASQSFVYSATVPSTFNGGAGTAGCGANRYPVANTATLAGTGGASAGVTLCVLATPSFTVTKIADDTMADPGQSVQYTITVTNNGKAAGSTTFTDDFDNRLSPSNAVSSPSGNNCSPTTVSGNKLFNACATGSIPAGGSQTFVYSATMPSTFSGPSGTDGCADKSYPVHNSVSLANQQSAGVTVCVGAAANFTVEKSVGNQTPVPGATVTYTVKVKNTGAAAGSTSFTDDFDDRMTIALPAGDCAFGAGTAAGTFTCQTGTIAAGDTVTFTYTGKVPDTFGPTSGGGDCADGSYPIANTATLAEGPDSTVELCVAAAPAYSVIKEVDDASATPGQVVHYKVTVKNTGTAAGTTGFVDDFDDRVTPTGIVIAPNTGSCSIASGSNRTLSCSTGVIPAGSQQVFTYAVTLPSAYTGESGEGSCDPGTYLVSNGVKLTGGAEDGVDVCVTAAPAFVVSKSVDNNAPEPGDTVQYTITVTNNGSAAGTTSFVDDYDNRLSPSNAVSNPVGNDCAPGAGSFSCTTGTIPSLGQQTFVYTATLPETFTGPGGAEPCAPGTYRIANAVELPGGADDEVVLCVDASPDFAVEKTVKTDGDVGPGDTVEYTVKVTNNGDASGSTVVVDDFDNRLEPTVPQGCQKAGGKLTCTTTDIPAGGNESFVYTAVIPASFTGTSGTGSCDPGEFQIANSVVVQGTTAADSVDLCVPAAPAFSVTKTADTTHVGAGDPVTYKITVRNTGTAPGSTQAVDDFDDRLAPPTATSAPAGNDCAPTTVSGNEQFRCPTASLDPGQSQTFTYTVAMPATFAAGASTEGCPSGQFAVLNSVQVDGDSDGVKVCVDAAPDFTVTKSANRGVAAPGDTVDYKITVKNVGTAAGSTTFTDQSGATISQAPAGCSLLGGHSFSCTTSVLAAGASQEFTYSADLPETYSGEADAESCDPPAYPVRNLVRLANDRHAETVVCVGAAPDFDVAKTVTDATLDPTDVASYKVKVTNVGTAPGSTTITDTPDSRYDLTGVTVPGCTLASGTFTCDTGELAAGASRTFTFDLTTPAAYTGTPGGGTCANDRYRLTNTAALPGGESSSVDVCVAAAPDFSVAKTADDRTVAAGEDVTYTVTVTNNGTAAGSTSFADDHDDRVVPGPVTISGTGGSCSDDGDVLSCDTGTIAAGHTQTFTYTAAMPATFTGAPGGGCGDSAYPVRNDVTLGDSSDSVTACVSAAPELSVDKTASTEVAAPGQTVTYTVTVGNSGTAPAPGSFTDTFANGLAPALVSADGADCDIAAGANASTLSCDYDLAAGDQATVVYTLTMPATFSGDSGGGSCDPGQYPVLNSVTASTRGDSADDSVTVCVDAEAQFSIEKQAEIDEPAPGATVSYSVVVTNNGTAPGRTSFVDDYDNRLDPTTPAGCEKTGGTLACDTGVIAAGDSQTFTYEATLPETFGTNDGTDGCAPGSFAVLNAVTLADGPGDGAKVCVPAAPDLKVTKSVDPQTGTPGQQVTYTVTVRNDGDAAGSTSFIDDYSDALTDVDVPDGCQAGSGSFSCDTGVIAAGSEREFVYTAKLPASFTGDSGGGDCDPGSYDVVNGVTLDNGETNGQTVCVTAAPDFTVTKEVDDATVLPGATVTYTITVKNVGDAEGSTTVVDDYDNRLDPSTPNGCEKADGKLTCSTGDLAAGESATFVYTAVVPATYTGQPGGGDCAGDRYRIANTAELDGGPSAGADVCVLAAPDFTVDKSVDRPTAEPGATVHYTITVTNDGDAEGSTTFVDDYDNRLNPTVPDGCQKAGGTLTCTTGVLAAGASQQFGYDAQLPATYSGTSGLAPCGPGEYGVANQVRIGDEEVASRTVCVPAAPKLGVTKTVSDQTPDPGQAVTYTITVSNTGSVAGSTSFTDDFDDRLAPTTPNGCEKVGGKLLCQTGLIEPGSQQLFTYTATMPNAYTGSSGGGGCQPGEYPVANGVVLAGGAGQAGVTACVAARAEVVLKKESSVDVRPNGDQVLTYTLTWTNNGAAEANGTVLTDALPAGTGFLSCTGGCSVGGSPTTATWQVGTIAPRGGTGSVTLVVKVTNNALCTVPNQAKMQVTPTVQVSSNQVSDNVTPQADPSSGKANGEAVGLEVKSSGLLTLITGLLQAIVRDKVTAYFSNAVSSQSGVGGPTTDSDSVLALKLPANGSVLSAGVLTTTSASSVTAAPAEARQTTTAEVAGVCLVPVAGVCTVETGTVRAVASTTANGGYATASSTGSAIQSLKVLGLDTPVNLNQTTTIPLNAAVFGKNSYVAINERTSETGLKQGKYFADQSVTMIHVKITGLLLGVQAVEIKVASATAHSEFLKTPLCGNQPNRSVSGHAFNARLFTGPLIADLTLGYTQIAPLGGSETEHIAGVALPNNANIVGAQVADSAATGSLNASGSTARSWAEIAGDGTRPVCVLRTGVTCVVSATVIRTEARSNAGPTGSTSTDTGTALVDLKVLGLPIAATPAPNTTLALPGIGFVVLNEQFCDGGSAASHSCAGTPHSGITVRAVRVVVTLANNLLGLTPGVELIVGEAHADSSFG